jgi:hypothetical protein
MDDRTGTTTVVMPPRQGPGVAHHDLTLGGTREAGGSQFVMPDAASLPHQRCNWRYPWIVRHVVGSLRGLRTRVVASIVMSRHTLTHIRRTADRNGRRKDGARVLRHRGLNHRT